jgi:hypothetical protein
MAANDGRAKLPSFETPGFAALCWAPQDEVREFEPISFTESLH